MMPTLLKNILHTKLRYFYFFFTHLRYRIFIALVASVAVGLLDGFGLAMLLSLLQTIDGASQPNPDDLGNLRFLLDFLNSIGLELVLETVLIFMLAIFIFKGVAKYFYLTYMVNTRRFFVRKIRHETIEALSSLSYKYFVLSDAGRIQNTMGSEVSRVINSFNRYYATMQHMVLVSVYLLLTLTTNAMLGLFVIAGSVLTNFIYRGIYTKSKGLSKEISTSGHGFQRYLIEKVYAFKYLKAVGGLDRYATRLKEKADEVEVAGKKIGMLGAVMQSTREPIIILVVMTVIFIQYAVFSQSITTVILGLLFLYRALTSLMQVQSNWNGFLSNCGSIDNIIEFMQEAKTNQECYSPELFGDAIEQISLKDVGFAYDDSQILRSICLNIQKNQTIAFVGESGSGKTTLVNLIAGLVQPDSGQLLINGNSITNFDIRSYQKNIGYITQEPVVFSDNVFNNITFWDSKTPENLDRFWQALRKASIDDFVRNLPEVEETEMRNSGLQMSGGQKQRFSIARELYKEVDVLILDEATSALDTETERSIQESIDQLKGKFTILIVAHRLSTIRNADFVVLMKNGQIEQTGTFDELIETSPYFARMVELQSVS
ncbi:MAG: ABC transporter ATP-binding protein [Cryomorphaceae bacterium]|nr:MAG: ABC transporter ATP-binding protein [Cryomorphaceae bacterium]